VQGKPLKRKRGLRQKAPLKRKMGLKTRKRLRAKKPLNKISPKMGKLIPELADLYTVLRRFCHNRSELSGRRPDWQSDGIIEPHHIDGRNGDKLLNPFNLIMLTAEEHTVEQQYRPGCHTRQELLDIVRPIRIKQGFKEEK
jgi:hypothetical protein